MRVLVLVSLLVIFSVLTVGAVTHYSILAALVFGVAAYISFLKLKIALKETGW